ncbi:MAG: PAS domain-containing protein [Gammaproteobacteria bacterium]|nr:PAS domain-containing protein [Gammaproteobacteria bacterium]
MKEELLSLRDRNICRRDYSLMQMRKDGSTYDTEESLHVLDHGDRAVLMLVVNDVTERRQADEMMLGGWEHATAILDSVGDPVIATDTGGVIVRLNQAAANLIDIPVFDAVGAPLDKLIHFRYPRTGESLQGVVGMCLRNGQQTQHDLLTFSTGNNQTERMVNLTLAPVSCGEGSVLGCVVTFRDIA